MKGDAMTEEQQQWIELGRRAVDCKGWRWMPGMLAMRAPQWWADTWSDVRIVRVLLEDSTIEYADPNDRSVGFGGFYSPIRTLHPCGWFPDLRDPGTQGCVLALVRESMRDPAFTLKRVWVEGDWHGEKGRCIASTHRKPWAWESFRHGHSASREGFDTEAEALVDALEQAQQRGAS